MCGIFGVFGHPEAANLTHLGLYALQHRGQESAGIAVWDGKIIRSHRGLGLTSEVFTPQILESLTGHTAVGHVRYSTTGSTLLKNAQPFQVNYARGAVAIAHNGNLVNATQLRYYGIDFPTREELIASSKSVEEIKNYLGLDSLGYLSLEGMLSAMPFPNENFCTACFTGAYPVRPAEEMGKFKLEF